MKILEIAKQPTSLTKEFLAHDSLCNGYHESLLRSWHVAQKVRELLELGTPPSVILEMMDVMEDSRLAERLGEGKP